MKSALRQMAQDRSDADFLSLLADRDHATASDLFGRGLNDLASATERRAIFRDDQASILRIRAAEIEARLSTSTDLMEIARGAR